MTKELTYPFPGGTRTVAALQTCQLLILYVIFPLESILQRCMPPANNAFVVT